MRILLISPCHKEFGGWYRADNIAQALIRKGHTVEFRYNKKYYSNIFIRLLIGLRNCKYILFSKYDIVHIFELLPPETLLPALLARLLHKRVALDLGDEYGYPPLRFRFQLPVCFIINFLDNFCLRLFTNITTTSVFLLSKPNLKTTKHKLKLINGVNTYEFKPVDRLEARKQLGWSKTQSVILSFGNTFNSERKRLLDELCIYLKHMRPSIKIIRDMQLNKQMLRLYLGASNIVLFPTGDAPNEKACFPIRVGSMLNAERVIATDDSDTEFHNTLRPYNCMITARDMHSLGLKIVGFLDNKQLQSEMEDKVRKAKKELDWDSLIVRLCEFYSKL